MTATKIQREGYYVERQFFANRRAQAIARAMHLADTYGRPVDVTNQNSTGRVLETVTIMRHARQQVAA